MAANAHSGGEGLELRGVALALGGRAVLREVSCTVPRGRVTIVVAPSGAGKSTLLRCCNRLLAVDRGTILLDGVDVTTIEATALRRRVGLVGQLPTMLPDSVRDNLAYGLGRERGGARGDRRDGERGGAGADDAALIRALEAAGLDGSFLPRAAGELSGGERARVALARALTRGPELLLLDEPTAALDAAAAAHVGATVRALAADGLGLLVATHDLDWAATVADRALALRDGVAIGGAPAEILGAAGAKHGAGDAKRGASGGDLGAAS